MSARAWFINEDGTEGLTCFFNTEEEARRWLDYYRQEPSFKRLAYGLTVDDFPSALAAWRASLR